MSGHYKVITRQKQGKVEYCTFLGSEYANAKLTITKITIEKNRTLKKNNVVSTLTKNCNTAQISNRECVIVELNKESVILPLDLSYNEIAHYMGAYFADGTKKGNSWAICASTPEQARYYLNMHLSIIKNANPRFNVSITVHKIDDSKTKADPEIFLRAAEALHVPPSECVVIEDSTNGLETAKKSRYEMHNTKSRRQQRSRHSSST